MGARGPPPRRGVGVAQRRGGGGVDGDLVGAGVALGLDEVDHGHVVEQGRGGRPRGHLAAVEVGVGGVAVGYDGIPALRPALVHLVGEQLVGGRRDGRAVFAHDGHLRRGHLHLHEAPGLDVGAVLHGRILGHRLERHQVLGGIGHAVGVLVGEVPAGLDDLDLVGQALAHREHVLDGVGSSEVRERAHGSHHERAGHAGGDEGLGLSSLLLGGSRPRLGHLADLFHLPSLSGRISSLLFPRGRRSARRSARARCRRRGSRARGSR